MRVEFHEGRTNPLVVIDGDRIVFETDAKQVGDRSVALKGLVDFQLSNLPADEREAVISALYDFHVDVGIWTLLCEHDGRLCELSKSGHVRNVDRIAAFDE